LNISLLPVVAVEQVDMALHTAVAVVVLVVTELQHSAVLRRAPHIRSLSVLVEAVALEETSAQEEVTPFLVPLRHPVVVAVVLISSLRHRADLAVERELQPTTSQGLAELLARDLPAEILRPKTSPLMVQVVVVRVVLEQMV
jgi:hypothetical protein